MCFSIFRMDILPRQILAQIDLLPAFDESVDLADMFPQVIPDDLRTGAFPALKNILLNHNGVPPAGVLFNGKNAAADIRKDSVRISSIWFYPAAGLCVQS